MRLKILSFLALSSLLLALVSCGPMYQTHRNYFPPKSSEGMRCVSHCLNSKVNCTSQCNSQKQFCISLNRVESAYRNAANCGTATTPKCPTPGFSTGIPYECSDAFNNCNDECLNMYDSCYMSCGGRVEYSQVCVAFCDKKK